MMIRPSLERMKDDAFFQRILAHQSDKRRMVGETMGRVLSVYLPTEFAVQVNQEIDWLLDSMLVELGRQPGVPVPDGTIRGGRALVVVGEAGAGKSRILRQTFLTRPEFRASTTDEESSSLLSVVAPSPFTLGALGNEIVRRLGYHGRREIKHSQVWPVVRALMKEKAIRILHIDEGQHGDEISSTPMMQEMENTLKRMMEESDWQTWLILSGCPALARFCQSDESMMRRVRVLRFERLRFPEHAGAVKGIVRSIVRLCPDIDHETLLTDEFAGRLLHPALYQFGILVEYVQDAIGECLAASSRHLSSGHFADVYAIRTGEPADDLNPFLARDWAAIPVEQALHDDAVDRTGKAHSRLKPRKPNGDRK